MFPWVEPYLGTEIRRLVPSQVPPVLCLEIAMIHKQSTLLRSGQPIDEVAVISTRGPSPDE